MFIPLSITWAILNHHFFMIHDTCVKVVFLIGTAFKMTNLSDVIP